MWKRVAAIVVVTGLAIGAYLFEPWRLFTSSTVNEQLPESTSSAPSDGGRGSTTSPTETPDQPAQPPEELATGAFETAEHETSGTARVLQLADGRRFVRLEDLATSDGPDLYIWLTDQPSGGDWGSYDDGRYLRLGELKATHGNQNYEIPADADIEGFTSVVIWCDRFNVAFASAPVTL